MRGSEIQVAATKRLLRISHRVAARATPIAGIEAKFTARQSRKYKMVPDVSDATVTMPNTKKSLSAWTLAFSDGA